MGVGKTILTYIHCTSSRELTTSSSIIRHLRQSTIPPTAIAYFYCNGSSFQKRNVRSVLGSLVKQLLLQQSPVELASVISLYDIYRELTPTADLLNAFTKILERMKTSFSRVYFVVDGIDEITDRRELLSLIDQLLSMTMFNILVVSRPERDIETAFAWSYRLKVEANIVQNDISSYVDWQLDHDNKLRLIKQPLKEEIKSKLISRSGGMSHCFY